MAIAYTVEKYLDMHHIPYDILSHPRATNSLKTAEAANIGADRLAKAILLEDRNGYLVAVLPASHHLSLRRLRDQTGRKVRMASEDELSGLFRDCELGAVPALGTAYGLDTVWDDSLTELPDVYFEAGDHHELIHVERDPFLALLGNARHGRFSNRV